MMKFSEKWLRELVDPKVSTEKLVEDLTMVGLELEDLEHVGNNFSGVVVGEVLEAVQHPNADKLRVCKVCIKKDAEPLTIVCGASNVRGGIKVPVATVGAKLPGDFVIKRAKLRGVESQGMICSEQELELAESSKGIMELASDAPLGVEMADYLELEDNIIELNVTPNRGDSLSLLGVAREVAAIYSLPLPQIEFEKVSVTSDATLKVKVSAPESCPRYLGRAITDVNVLAATPTWMQTKLQSCGLRSINILVDITNYVLLELGQPMHAFDFDKIDQGLDVRLAKDGEVITLLDENELALTSEALVIADAKNSLALAGVMGGLDSAISETTKNIFLESAFFTPTVIAKTSQRYTLSSDSSHRFERGVDPELQRQAMERASQLVVELAGGKCGEIIEVKSDEYLPQPKPLHLHADNIKRLLGIDIANDKITNILQRLNISCSSVEDGWQVVPPSYRSDIAIEQDYIEEIARIYGYNSVPEHEPSLFMPSGDYIKQNWKRNKERCLFDLLVTLGFNEIVTYGFVDQKLQSAIEPKIKPLKLSNPISSEASVMRLSLWPGLLNTLVYNQKRKATNLKLFTTGVCFIPGEKFEDLQQKRSLAGLVSVDSYKESWQKQDDLQDNGYFVVKNYIEQLLAWLHIDERVTFVKEEHAALHPGVCSRIYLGKKSLGWIGKLHPTIAQQLDLTSSVYLFDLDVESLFFDTTSEVKPVSKYPLVKRDIAIIVDKKWSWQEIYTHIRKVGKSFLQDVELFDIYEGKGIKSGTRSLAMHLVLQKLTQTFTESEIEHLITKIIESLNKEFDANLRG